MTYYRCVRDDAITEIRFSNFQEVKCKLCGGTLESSLHIETNKADIKAYKDRLNMMTCNRDLIWNEEFTKILGHRLYTEKGIIEDMF